MGDLKSAFEEATPDSTDRDMLLEREDMEGAERVARLYAGAMLCAEPAAKFKQVLQKGIQKLKDRPGTASPQAFLCSL